MTDYSFDSKTIVLNAINADKGTFILASDVDFVSVTKNTTGPYNTSTNMVARESGHYRDNVVINYNRTPLSKTFSQPIVFMALGNIATTADLIARINAQYGRNLSVDDVYLEPVVPSTVNADISVFTLKAANASLAYTDGVDVYFSSSAALKDWIHYPNYQYAADGKTFTFDGTALRTADTLLLGKKGTMAPTNDSVAIAMSPSATFGLLDAYPVSDVVRARLQQGQLVEILGPSGETSYDSLGQLLPALPTLPPVFDALANVFLYSGTLAANHMNFSSDYTVTDFYVPFGNVYYVDSVAGVDSADGLTPQTPVKSINAALVKLPQANVVVLKSGGTYSMTPAVNSRQIAFVVSEPGNQAVISGGILNPTWTAAAQTSTYSTPVSTGIAGVVDYALADANGAPFRLPLAANVNALGTMTGGGYFTDGTKLSVRTPNGRQPDASLVPIKADTGLLITGNSTVYLSDVILKDTAYGLVAESLDASNKPTVYLHNVQLTTTTSLSNMNAFGANLYSENVTAQYGFKGGSFYGGDRQSISLGISSQFIEKNCTFANFMTGAVGSCLGSTAQRGSVGIRFDSVYQNCNGYPIQDFGVGTATANFNPFALSNSVTDAKTGALMASGNETPGLDGRCVQLILSSVSANQTKFTYVTLGSGEQHLYDTPVGPVAQYGKASPYNFLYSSLGA